MMLTYLTKFLCSVQIIIILLKLLPEPHSLTIISRVNILKRINRIRVLIIFPHLWPSSLSMGHALAGEVRPCGVCLEEEYKCNKSQQNYQDPTSFSDIAAPHCIILGTGLRGMY